MSENITTNETTAADVFHVLRRDRVHHGGGMVKFLRQLHIEGEVFFFSVAEHIKNILSGMR